MDKLQKSTDKEAKRREQLRKKIRAICADCLRLAGMDAETRAEYEMMMEYRNGRVLSMETADGERIETAARKGNP